jgi:hypothetical protein
MLVLSGHMWSSPFQKSPGRPGSPGGTTTPSHALLHCLGAWKILVADVEPRMLEHFASLGLTCAAALYPGDIVALLRARDQTSGADDRGARWLSNSQRAATVRLLTYFFPLHPLSSPRPARASFQMRGRGLASIPRRLTSKPPRLLPSHRLNHTQPLLCLAPHDTPPSSL